MLLTSPLITTVGLSLTIPLSLIGQMIEYKQTSGVLYWLGACIVLLSFVFINHESKYDKNPEDDDKEVRSFNERFRQLVQDTWDRYRRKG